MTAEQRILKHLREHEKPVGGTMKMAELLAVPASTWVRLRDGQRPLNARIADSAAKAFPELTSDSAYFLLNELPRRNPWLQSREATA